MPRDQKDRGRVMSNLRRGRGGIGAGQDEAHGYNTGVPSPLFLEGRWFAPQEVQPKNEIQGGEGPHRPGQFRQHSILVYLLEVGVNALGREPGALYGFAGERLLI
ncbi:hypothetical protein CR513_21032, partial [Mucuna pruriens]